MLLDVVIAIVCIGLTATVALALAAEAKLATSVQLTWSTDRLALVLVVMLGVLVASRSLLFGVDTAAYAAVLDSYCAGQGIAELGMSFAISARLLNWMMLGACDIRLLPMAWVLAIVFGILVAAGSLSEKLRYLAVLMVSLVGIELTTNALRQGLSAVLLVAAVSWWWRGRIISLVLAAASIIFHSSSILVLLAIVAAALSWRWFLLGVAAAGLLVVVALQQELAVGPMGAFLYEIQKYLGHEPDEMWIRLLSITSLMAILIVPWFSSDPDSRSALQWRAGSYAWSARLASTSLPFLALPYFGYRYIYGVLPIVLWLVMGSMNCSRRAAARTFYLLLAVNCCLLAVWSYGSNYMRTVPFVE